MTGLFHISDFVGEELPLIEMTKLLNTAGIGTLTDHVSLRYILYSSFMQGCPGRTMNRLYRGLEDKYYQWKNSARRLLNQFPLHGVHNRFEPIMGP